MSFKTHTLVFSMENKRRIFENFGCHTHTHTKVVHTTPMDYNPNLLKPYEAFKKSLFTNNLLK